MNNQGFKNEKNSQIEEKPPFCPKCAIKAVKRDAGLMNNIFYWFCPNCKEEVFTDVEEKKENTRNLSFWDTSYDFDFGRCD